MKPIIFSYKNSCRVSDDQINKHSEQLHQEITRIQQSQKNGYNTDYASLNLLHDKELIHAIHHAIKEKKEFNPTILIVIGIGGSNLATVALIEALYGKFYNDKNPLPIYFADTVDSDYLSSILCKAEKELCSGNNIILNVISKSGTTTETVVNFELFFELLKKHRPYSYEQFVVITTDKNSPLWEFGQSESMALLEIPQKVGGRYSAFSAVGMFPLAFCDININDLHSGAHDALQQCTTLEIHTNPAALSASILYELYQQKYTIHDSFLFSVELESLGKWYRQLMAESIGKSHNKSEIVVNNGITPTVSIGSTDLHSVAQLYLSGPYTTSTTFVSVEKNKHNLCIPENSALNNIIPNISNKSLSTIMDAILQGTMTAYRNNNRPYMHIQFLEINEYYLGYFMQMKMLEIMYLGFLMNINPFDQPNVELYKKETKKILENN